VLGDFYKAVELTLKNILLAIAELLAWFLLNRG